jgi:hypothetical protein
MLDEFVCDAIHNPETPQADSRSQGRNEPIHVIEERVIEERNDLGGDGSAGDKGRTDQRNLPVSRPSPRR